MLFFAIIGWFVFFYYLISLILWLTLDSDIELFVKSLVGKKISSLSGKVVWITGASSGIGKSLALTLAKYGVKLVISARRGAELELVKQECLRVSNGKLLANDILVMQMDMLQTDKHQRYFEAILQHFGRLDVLVNNAGRSQRAAWQDVELKVDKDLFDLDVFSVVNLTRIVVKYFLNAKIDGQIAVTSSTAGLLAVPNSCSYTGAKHAIHGYFGALQVEQPHLKVTIFCPGPTFSEFLQEAFTGTDNEKYGISVQPTDRRMTSERCGELFAVAIANKIFISFVGCFPIPLLVQASSHFPNVKNFVVKLVGRQAMSRLRDSR